MMGDGFGYMTEVHVSPTAEPILVESAKKHDVTYHKCLSNYVYASLEAVEIKVERALQLTESLSYKTQSQIFISKFTEDEALRSVVIVVNQYIFNLIIHKSEVNEFYRIQTDLKDERVFVLDLVWLHIQIE